MRVGIDHKVPDSKCTACGYAMNGAICVGEDAAPDPGDFTVCIECGHLMIFGDGLILRNPTDAEMIEIAGDERLLAIQEARRNLPPRITD